MPTLTTPELKITPEMEYFFFITDSLKKTTRAINVPDTDRKENVAEHSFEIAMFAWYMIETYDLQLDLLTCLKYALSHDLGEAIVGDVCTLDKTEAHELEEELAVIDLIKQFEYWTSPRECYQADSEKLAEHNKEARFIKFCDVFVGCYVYYLDKMRAQTSKTIQDVIYVMNRHNFTLLQPLMDELFEKQKEMMGVTDDVTLRDNSTVIF